MRLFKRKEAKIVPTLTVNLIKVIREHDEEIANYRRMKINVQNFITKFKNELGVDAYISGDKLTLYLRKQHGGEYPDGFFAFADKLGLTIEPICSTIYTDNEKPFSVRAKSK